MKRAANKAERDHMDAVAAMGCIVCEDNGYPDTPATIHHVGNQGTRASHFDVIPLCPFHHQHGNYGEAIHSGRLAWEGNFGTEKVLLSIVTERIKKAAG